jgi:hypothetical protein
VGLKVIVVFILLLILLELNVLVLLVVLVVVLVIMVVAARLATFVLVVVVVVVFGGSFVINTSLVSPRTKTPTSFPTAATLEHTTPTAARTKIIAAKSSISNDIANRICCIIALRWALRGSRAGGRPVACTCDVFAVFIGANFGLAFFGRPCECALDFRIVVVVFIR